MPSLSAIKHSEKGKTPPCNSLSLLKTAKLGTINQHWKQRANGGQTDYASTLCNAVRRAHLKVRCSSPDFTGKMVARLHTTRRSFSLNFHPVPTDTMLYCKKTGLPAREQEARPEWFPAPRACRGDCMDENKGHAQLLDKKRCRQGSRGSGEESIRPSSSPSILPSQRNSAKTYSF